MCDTPRLLGVSTHNWYYFKMTNPLRKANDNSRTGRLPSVTTAVMSVVADVADKTTRVLGSSSKPATSELSPSEQSPMLTRLLLSNNRNKQPCNPTIMRRPSKKAPKKVHNKHYERRNNPKPLNYFETIRHALTIVNTIDSEYYHIVIGLGAMTPLTSSRDQAEVLFYTLKLMDKFLERHGLNNDSWKSSDENDLKILQITEQCLDYLHVMEGEKFWDEYKLIVESKMEEGDPATLIYLSSCFPRFMFLHS